MNLSIVYNLQIKTNKTKKYEQYIYVYIYYDRERFFQWAYGVYIGIGTC